MIQTFPIIFASSLFYVGLELILSHNDWVAMLAFIITIITLYQAQKIGGRVMAGIIPTVFALSTVMLLYLVDSPHQQQALIFLSFCVYFLAFFGIYRLRYNEHDKSAQSLISLTSMTASFFAYASLYGIYLNFAFSVGEFMLAYACVTMLLSYQYLRLIDKGAQISKVSQGRASIYSFILGLAIAQIAWIVTFWPFGYLTTGVIVLMMHYILWFLVESHFRNTLSKKSVFVHSILFIFLIGMVLMSTRWAPIV